MSKKFVERPMLDRIADYLRAITLRQVVGHPGGVFGIRSIAWEEMDEYAKEHWRSLARQILSMMCDPTEGIASSYDRACG